MERVLGEFHHLMAVGPGIQAHVHQRRGHPVGQRSHCRGCIVDAAAAEEGAHALTHQLLLWVGGAEIVELLAPHVDLIAQVYLGGTECLTRVAERAGTDIA